MRFRLLALAGCLVFASVAGTAAAQDRAGTFEISPFGGGYFGGNLYDSGRGHVDVQSDWAYGARLAYNVNRVFGIEFDWTHSKADLEGHGFGNVAGYPPYPSSGKIGQLTQDIFEANGIISWGKGRASGYFGFGGGAAVLKTEFNGAGSTSETRFTGNMSLGFKGFVTPRFGFRIDGRWRYIDTDHTTSHNTYCDYYGYCYSYHTTWYSNGELTGGLIFAF
ncbi:MAG TPA: outer membrane beta-barrel protein [Thermoanaerobaculia bacterium]|nr:outer membrane beta-barrel protein [Thermoanaerobaculia bacterium]